VVGVGAERVAGPRRPVVDLTEEEARRALPLKWGTVPPGVIPAWVAEMDYAVDPVVLDALRRMVDDGITGYPLFGWDPELAESYAGWAARHFDWAPEPEAVLPVVDVTAGVRVAIEVFSGPGGVVFPVPGYNAHHGLASVTGREEVRLEVPTAADRAEIDLDRLDRLFADGAQTLILTQPHNPWGRVFTRAELEGVRDVVVRHGARVVCDEIHAPLVLPGAEHVSYLSLDGTADHAVAVVAASKAFNTAGLRCAQLVVPDPASRQRLVDQPMSRNESYSTAGIVAARAAYDHGDGWLASLVERLDQQRTLLAELLAAHLPLVRMRPLEATYLAWLDASAYGHDDAAAVALERGRVKVSPGQSYAPGTTCQVRLNIATSPARLTEIVERLARAWV
jgi:cystathionine beta-lyase